MEENQEVKIGKYTLKQKEYADKFWIYGEGGEGMALGDESLAELEKLIEDFYKRNL